MNDRRRIALLAPILGLACAIATPAADAGSSFGLYVGGGGFGVSVGFGDWGVYTQSWSDPYWSIDFDAVLAGYGEWVWVDGLGRVWRPWVAASWRPYTYGRWVATSLGWTWVAYEPWGYVPHHYGNWAYCNFGWVWRPGYTYSCANVTWVRAGGYVGWYARPPYGWSHAAHGFKNGFRDGYRTGYRDGYRDGSERGWNDARYGTYVGWNHFGAENVAHQQVAHQIVSQGRVVQDGARAPSDSELRQRGGAVPVEVRLSQRTVTMGGRAVSIARPEGVSRSVERYAAETVSSALAPAALEQRQPMARPRPAGTAAAATWARSSAASRESRLSPAAPAGRISSSTRTERSDISARSAGPRSVTGNASQAGTARPTSSRPVVRVAPEVIDKDCGTSRTVTGSGGATSSPSRSTRPQSIRAQPGSQQRSAVQPPPQTSASQQRQILSRQPATDRRQEASVQQSASASRRSQSNNGKSAAPDESGKTPERRSRQTSRPQRH